MRPHFPKSLLFLMVLFFTVALTMSRDLRIAGRVKVGQESQESVKDRVKVRYPIADSLESEPSDPKERAKRLKRSKRYNGKTTVVGPQLVQSSEGYNWPEDFKAIPVSASDVIVVGTISEAKAHLSQDRNSVYSEFTS